MAELATVTVSHPQALPCAAGAGKLHPPVFAFASSSPPARLACEEPEIARPEGKKKGEAPSRYQKPEQRASLWLQEQVPGVWLARFPHTPGLAEPRSGIFSCKGTLLRASTLVMVLTSSLCSLPW